MQVEIDQVNKVVFLHVHPLDDNTNWVNHAFEQITSAYPNFRVVVLPNGKPMPGHGRPGFYICKESEASMALVKKFMGAKIGEMIPLSDREWEAYMECFKPVPLPIEGE